MIVIAIGLLGITETLALSINNATISRNRSLAAIEAQGLAAMMHANANAYLNPLTGTNTVAYWQSKTNVPLGTTITINCSGVNSNTGRCHSP